MRLAFACLFLALPAAASAQIAGPHDYGPVAPANPFLGDSSLPGPGIYGDLRQARKNIDRARNSGFISRREARQMRREARSIERLANVYSRDGLSDSEKRELETRALALRGRAASGH